MLWGCFDGKLPLKSTFEEKLYARCFGANGRSEKCLKTGPINLTEMLFSRWFSWELQYEMFWSFLKQKCQTIAVSVRNVLLLFVHNWSSFYAHQRQTFSCLKQVNCDLQSCCKPWHCFGWLPVSLAVSDPSILATSPHRMAKSRDMEANERTLLYSALLSLLLRRHGSKHSTTVRLIIFEIQNYLTPFQKWKYISYSSCEFVNNSES